jgi:hypothetical protein
VARKLWRQMESELGIVENPLMKRTWYADGYKENIEKYVSNDDEM